MRDTQKMIDILRRLKIEMNGAVAEAMQERGVNYGLNYGVSSVTIKNIAKEYAPDHALAIYLFKQDVRELKIAAIYIDNAQDVTTQQMDLWIEQCTTDELIEHATMGLFYAAESAESVSLCWLQQGRHKAALHIIGKRASMRLLERPDISLSTIVAGVQAGDIKCVNTTVYALCKIALISDKLREDVIKSLDEIDNHIIVNETKSLL